MYVVRVEFLRALRAAEGSQSRSGACKRPTARPIDQRQPRHCEGEELGATDFFLKPVTPIFLKNSSDDFLRKKIACGATHQRGAGPQTRPKPPGFPGGALPRSY